MQQELVALHRYYIWANRMRIHFDEVLSSSKDINDENIEAMLYMSYWYAGLYVVIEGWQELKLKDDIIDSFLTSPHVDLLRRYRNGVFHFQAKYYDERFIAFMSEGASSAEWVRNLNRQFGRYFIEKHQERKNLSE